jgi:cell division protein FtsL
MAMKKLFLKSDVNPEKMVLVSIYIVLAIVIITGISVIHEKYQLAREYCAGKGGVLLQDKGGEFHCIKSKSVITLSD